ncbi:MAG: agmatinase family protein [Myxococcota bacterium]
MVDAREQGPERAEFVEGIFGRNTTPEEAATILVGVPWEATTSYGRGTAAGPDAIFAASPQLDLYDVELGRVDAAGIAMVTAPDAFRRRAERAAKSAEEVISKFDGGRKPSRARLAEVNEASRDVDAWVETEVGRWLEDDKLVGTVGGDHSVALGAIRAHAARYEGLGVLQFDAHADLREAYQGFLGSHASVMHNVLAQTDVSLVSVGLRDLCEEEYQRCCDDPRVTALFDAELQRRALTGESLYDIVMPYLDRLPGQVYVSFDIDGFDPSLCPHTGTPVPGGLNWAQAMFILRTLGQSGRRVVGFDVCEVAPGPRGEWDANVGARLIYKLIGLCRGHWEGK